MFTKHRSLQGAFPFEGAGMDKPALISPELSYLVPEGRVSQVLYLRGGNSADELVSLILMRDGAPIRYFPVGAKSGVHVSLRVVEEMIGGSLIELHLLAPKGLVGTAIVDMGFVDH